MTASIQREAPPKDRIPSAKSQEYLPKEKPAASPPRLSPLSPRESQPGGRAKPDKAPQERKVAEFCFTQREICRKICNLRFRDYRFGCPQTCDSRVTHCNRTNCYRWSEPELVIAERFGGYRCAL
ncbi:MAG: hypothetical protein HC850_13265 [Rhodomicrobium sp.]|nr:hypothetical protein [Rhodomicrobium sp.]